MIKLVRLDYRLLHGQVVFAWTGHTGAQRIIVVDDDAATDELKKSALTLSKPAGVRLNIFTLEKTLAKMPKVRQLDENIMMIFGNVATLKAFCDANPDITEINYGGLANRRGQAVRPGHLYDRRRSRRNKRAALPRGEDLHAADPQPQKRDAEPVSSQC